MEKETKVLNVLFGVYAASLIMMNVLATKSIDIGLFTVTTGIFVSPIVFIVQDVVTELFGFKKAKDMIMLGFAMAITATLLYQLAIWVEPSVVFANQEAFSSVLSTTFRITIASLSAYTVGSLTNSKIMHQLKTHNDSLFVRAISSTIVGQFLDNLIFAFIAFYGVMPLSNVISMAFGGTLIEVVYEIIFYPATKGAIAGTSKYLQSEQA